MRFEYEVKAATDMSGITQSTWANTPLQQQTTIYVKLRMRNPVNVGTFNYGGVYIPDEVLLEIEGTQESAPGSQFANGGNFASVTVLNHPTGFWQGDGLFLNIEPRALPGLPFGDIGNFSLRLWLDNGAFSTIDPPTDAKFMSSWPSLSHPSKIEWNFLNPGGIGTGFNWAVTGIDKASVGIQVS
ncbi:hypothetical protein GCM10027020_03210 [Nocardioides salsibiostraticola]